MFALNEGYKWQSTKFADSLHGVVYLPSFNHAERMRRKPLGDFSWQLFDPQLYLAGLDCGLCTKVCARLATFPWFGVTGLPDFNSGDESQRDWEQRVQGVIRRRWKGGAPTGNSIPAAARAAVEFQANVGCTHIVLPTPLVAEREDEAQAQAEWIDAGLEAAANADLGQPIIATVAVSESVLNDPAFDRGGFLDTIVDQVSSRDGLGGVYIVVGQEQSQHPLLASNAVIRAYAHLTRAFVGCGYEFVFLNFADTFGVSCVGLGASGFATGPSQSLRRLSLAAFRDEGGGTPLPRLYSHRVIGEFLPERELAVLAQRNLLRRVADQTVYSRDLFRALAQSGSAATVAAWVESRNNVTAATLHFIARMISEGATYSARKPSQRSARAERWIEDAMVEQDFLTRRLADSGVEPIFAPASDWLEHFRGNA